MWQMLQISAALDHEFLGALSRQVPAVGWCPEMRTLDFPYRREQPDTLSDPPVQVRSFPLQRGYSRWPLSLLANIAVKQTERLRRTAPDPERSPLICTTPYWAPVAEKWPGPVVYYLTDLIAAYDRANASLVKSLDARMCAAAALVCPNSQTIADYLKREAGCPSDRIEIIPNATRAANLLPGPSTEPGPLPPDLEGLSRPVAGVIGNLASNMDWVFLEETIASTPSFSWAFIGPYKDRLVEREQSAARERLLRAGGRIRFTGGKKYGELCALCQIVRCSRAALLSPRTHLVREFDPVL